MTIMARVVFLIAILGGVAYLGFIPQLSGTKVLDLEVPLSPGDRTAGLRIPTSKGNASSRIHLSPEMNPIRVLVRAQYVRVHANVGGIQVGTGGLSAIVSMRSSKTWSWSRTTTMATSTSSQPGVGATSTSDFKDLGLVSVPSEADYQVGITVEDAQLVSSASLVLRSGAKRVDLRVVAASAVV